MDRIIFENIREQGKKYIYLVNSFNKDYSLVNIFHLLISSQKQLKMFFLPNQ